MKFPVVARRVALALVAMLAAPLAPAAEAPRDGRVLWRTDVFGWTWGTPLVVGNRIYVGAAGGKPYMIDHVASFDVLDRKTGAIVERWPLPEVAGAHQRGIGGSLAQDGDTIVATTIEGGVYGFGTRS